MDDLTLFGRTGLPDEVAAFRALHPRPWDERALGDLARFWLGRHALFRRFAGVLMPAAEGLRSGAIPPAEALPRLAQSLNAYLGELQGHHSIEDHHYFPAFRAADPRLARGFEVLDADHHALDALIHALVDRANALGRGEGDPRRAADDLGATLERTIAGVARHLDDEEDIIIPLLLARTDLGG
jgi:hemerythrin-like domain-containing protein